MTRKVKIEYRRFVASNGIAVVAVDVSKGRVAPPRRMLLMRSIFSPHRAQGYFMNAWCKI